MHLSKAQKKKEQGDEKEGRTNQEGKKEELLLQYLRQGGFPGHFNGCSPEPDIETRSILSRILSSPYLGEPSAMGGDLERMTKSLFRNLSRTDVHTNHDLTLRHESYLEQGMLCFVFIIFFFVFCVSFSKTVTGN